MQIVKRLAFNKETKNAVRYQETTDNRPMNVYLSKDEAGYPNHPDRIRITITEE